MSEPRETRQRRSFLNPALKSRTDKTHDTKRRTPAPADSASVQREEGQAWPIIWLVVTLACIAIAVYLLIG